MLPRHSRTQPFEIRIRSFGCTRSISSFHRVIWTSSPSASFALQSHTFQRIDNEFRDLKHAENSNVDEIRKILNRQAEALSYLVTRVKDLETRLEVEETWDTSVEEVIKLMALDDAKIWKFRKHKEVYEEIARKGVGETAETL